MPRLLAYGGTGWRIRQQIGAWPEFDESNFRDSQGIHPMSFGALRDSQGAYVIVRRPLAADGRVYPYTLLFDPGVEGWSRVRWNGARLIETILAPHAAAMFEAPESVQPDFLADFCSGLEGSTHVTGSEQSRAAWVGAILQRAEQIRETALTENVPIGPAELAGVLDAVPVPFRCGWLLRDTAFLASRLKTRLWISETAHDQVIDVARAMAFLRAWSSVEQSETAAALGNLLRDPWQLLSHADADLVLSGLEILGSALFHPTDEFFAAVMNREFEGNPLRHLLYAAAERLLARDGVKGPHETRYVLSLAAERGEGSLPAALVGSLDEATVVQHMVGSRRLPTEWAGSAPLHSSIQRRVWSGLIESAVTPAEVRRLFAVVDGRDAQLVELVLGRCVALEASISETIRGVEIDRAKASIVREFVAARRDLDQRSAADYVTLGEPWPELDADVGTCEKILGLLVRTPSVPRARELVAHVAASPIRSQIAIDVKLRVGREFEAFRALDDLNRLLHGSPDHVRRSTEPIPADEAAELVRRAAEERSVPNVAAIDAHFPDVTDLLMASGRRDSSAAPVREALHQVLRTAASLEGGRRRLDYVNGLRDSDRAEVAALVLYGGGESDDGMAVEVLYDLERAGRGSDGIAGPRGHDQVQTWVRRFVWHHERMELALRLMRESDRQNVISRIVSLDPTRAALEVYYTFALASLLGPPRSALALALLQSLSAHDALVRAAAWFFGPHDSPGTAALQLSHLIDEATIEEPPEPIRLARGGTLPFRYRFRLRSELHAMISAATFLVRPRSDISSSAAAALRALATARFAPARERVRLAAGQHERATFDTELRRLAGGTT